MGKLIVGDCIKELKKIPDQSVKLVFADPPYNNGCKYDSYIDNRNDYEQWCSHWFRECRRIAEKVIITPGHGNVWMWGNIEIPRGIGCWYKPGNPASSILGWVTWEPWLYYSRGSGILGGPDTIRATVSKQLHVEDHPCPKPLDLLVQIILKATKPGDIVLDPFCGSGTTIIAAQLTDRRWVGIDISRHYVDITKGRLKLIKSGDLERLESKRK